MLCCKKKAKIDIIEFWDHCQDGSIDLVKEVYDHYEKHESHNPKELIESVDPDKKSALHLVRSPLFIP
jgi:hypothetical protein